MTALGLTSDQVGEMTVHDALDLFAYWRRVPPVAETMLAAFGGGESKQPQATPHRASEGELRAMADLLNGRR